MECSLNGRLTFLKHRMFRMFSQINMLHNLLGILALLWLIKSDHWCKSLQITMQCTSIWCFNNRFPYTNCILWYCWPRHQTQAYNRVLNKNTCSGNSMILKESSVEEWILQWNRPFSYIDEVLSYVGYTHTHTHYNETKHLSELNAFAKKKKKKNGWYY